MEIRVASKLVPLDPNFEVRVEVPDSESGSSGLLFQTVERFNNRQVEVLTVWAVDDGE